MFFTNDGGSLTQAMACEGVVFSTGHVPKTPRACTRSAAIPAGWRHFPSLRHAAMEQTQVMVSQFIAVWDRDELGPWVVKNPSDQSIIGYGGCSARQDILWNRGYRFAFDAQGQGQGFATELAHIMI